MTIDVASLVFEIDSTQAVVARERLEALEKAGASVDATATKTKSASDKANAAHREAAAQITKLLEKVGAYEAALGSAGKAGAFDKVRAEAAKEAAAWQKVEDAIERRNAAYRGDLAAQQLKNTEQAALAEAKALAQSAAEWDKIHVALERRNAALRGDLAAKQALDNAKALATEEAAWERIDAALDKRNAKLRGEQAIAAMKAEAEAVTSLEARIDRLMNSIDPTRAAQARLNAEMQEAAALYKAGAISASDYARATSVLDQRLADAARGHDAYAKAQSRVAGSSGAVARAGLNMSRQFTDIGVQLAGQTPLYLVLIQQLPQLADGFAQAKIEGAGFSAVMGGMAAAMSPLAPLLVIGGALGAMFLMLHHDAKESLGNVANDLDLTDAQLKRVKDSGVTMGDTLRAVFKTTGQLLYGALKSPIDDLRAAFDAWYADLVTNTMKELQAIVSVFAGGYGAIKAVWSQLPAAMADVAVSAANGVISAIEAMVNKAIDSINALMTALKPALAMGVFGPAGQSMAGLMRPIGHVEFGALANPNAGAATKVMSDAAAAYAKDAQNAGKLIDKASELFLKNLRETTEKRIRKEAGEAAKGAKGPATPRDMSDERAAQIAQLIAQAKADELQAQLALTVDVAKRAEIERRLIDIQLAGQLAQLDRQAANIKDDAGLSKARKEELLLQLEGVRIKRANVAALQEELIERNKREAIRREVAAAKEAEWQNQIDVLNSQKGVTRYAFQREKIEREILKAKQALERLALEEIIASETATEKEKQRARERLEALKIIHGNQAKAAYGTAEDAYNALAREVGNAIDAFKNQDWNALVTALVEAFGRLRQVFTEVGFSLESKIGALAGVGSVIGNAIGGKTGSTISGAASGAMAGMQIGSIIPGIGTAVGAAVGAIVGGIGGFLGGKSKEKEARMQAELARQQAEHQRALDIANAKREQEIRLLELSGKSIEALKLRREAELAAMDASLQANQVRIWQLEDEKAAAEARAALDIRLMDAQGRASESLALKRAREIAAANDNERGMLRQIFAAEDVATAREALSAAYERESAALQATIDKFRAFTDGLKRFRDQLYSGPAAMLSPEEQYRATKANFDRTAALAAGGNEDAIRDLESVSQAYLDASKAYYASSEAYFADLERVRAAVTATQAYAASQVSAAEAQLSALNASVAGILGVQGAVLSVKDALAAYNAAIQAQIAAANDNKTATPGANDNTPAIQKAPDWASYIRSNPDVAAEYARLSPNNLKNNLGVTSIEQFGQWHWQHYGQAEGRKPYATGGIMDRPITLGESGIGGEAGPEGILPLTNVGGRMGVHAVMPDMSEVVGELKSLRNEVNGLRRELTAANTQRGDIGAKVLKKVDQLIDAADDQARADRQAKAAA